MMCKDYKGYVGIVGRGKWEEKSREKNEREENEGERGGHAWSRKPGSCQPTNLGHSRKIIYTERKKGKNTQGKT